MALTHTIVAAAGLALAAAGTSTEDWPMHSMDRPLPPVVDPGPAPGPEAAPPPSDAVVLLGPDAPAALGAWQHPDGSAPKWALLEDGSMQVTKGTGTLRTRDVFGDQQLHIEWMCPADQGHRTGQNRGNSGVFLMGTYEVQVLSSRENRTYADGMAGAVYGQSPPLVNACRPMGEWNAYDIVFRRPRFAEDGSVISPARVTVHLNGVLVQDAFELVGPASHRVQRPYAPHADALSLELQDHGEPVRFRNAWVRRLE